MGKSNEDQVKRNADVRYASNLTLSSAVGLELRKLNNHMA